MALLKLPNPDKQEDVFVKLWTAADERLAISAQDKPGTMAVFVDLDPEDTIFQNAINFRHETEFLADYYKLHPNYGSFGGFMTVPVSLRGEDGTWWTNWALVAFEELRMPGDSPTPYNEADQIILLKCGKFSKDSEAYPAEDLTTEEKLNHIAGVTLRSAEQMHQLLKEE